jgi:hypothetical protein
VPQTSDADDRVSFRDRHLPNRFWQIEGQTKARDRFTPAPILLGLFSFSAGSAVFGFSRRLAIPRVVQFLLIFSNFSCSVAVIPGLVLTGYPPSWDKRFVSGP